MSLLNSSPRLTFSIDPEKDISTFFSFVEDAKYDEGRNLEWAVFKGHPELRRYFKNTKFVAKQSDISEYIEKIYARDKERMFEWRQYCENLWNKNEDRYFSIVQGLFDSSFWKEGKYIAYPTLWGMYPRFLQDKTFQLPYTEKKREKLLFIIAHEMLHFIFYEYFFSKYPKYREGDYDFFLWNVSEIFNTVVQGSKSFPRDMNDPESAYPEHEDIVSHLQKEYKEVSRENVDTLIETIMQMVKKMES